MDTIALPASSSIVLNSALPRITSEISIRGNGSTVRRSASAPEFGILGAGSFEGSYSPNVSIEDLTISGAAGSQGFGLSNATNVTLTRCTISGNAGGIDSSGTLTLVDSSISGNTAIVGLYVRGGTAHVSNTSISRNYAGDGGYGGGVRIRSGGAVYLLDSSVSNNTAANGGGGIYNQFSTLVLSNSTVSGNVARGAFGGGIHNRGAASITGSTISGNRSKRDGGGIFGEGGNLNLLRSTVSDNSTRAAGGGIHSRSEGALTFVESAVSGNSADEGGGGIFALTRSLEVINSTISGNHASYGAGIYAYKLTKPRGTVIVRNTTVSENTATDRGGGLMSSGTELELRGNLIAGNVAPIGAEMSLGRVVITADEFNLFGYRALTNSQAFSGFTPSPADLTATRDGTVPTALRLILVPVALYPPRSTRTHALAAGSPAMNAGGAQCSAIDQRGVIRPQGAACDIGAFEDDGRDLVPSLRIRNARLAEGSAGESIARFRVTLSFPAPADVRVSYRTLDASATAGTDYVAESGTLSFAEGEISKSIEVPVLTDVTPENDERFRIKLSRSRGATIEDGIGLGIILDDD